MKPSSISQALEVTIDIQQPTFLWGPPGVAKDRSLTGGCPERDHQDGKAATLFCPSPDSLPAKAA